MNCGFYSFEQCRATALGGRWMSLYAEDCASKADGMANESTYFSEYADTTSLPLIPSASLNGKSP